MVNGLTGQSSVEQRRGILLRRFDIAFQRALERLESGRPTTSLNVSQYAARIGRTEMPVRYAIKNMRLMASLGQTEQGTIFIADIQLADIEWLENTSGQAQFGCISPDAGWMPPMRALRPNQVRLNIQIATNIRKCSSCRLELPLAEFKVTTSRHRRRISSLCRKCQRAADLKSYYRSRRDDPHQQQRRAEYARVYNPKWKAKNANKVNAYHRRRIANWMTAWDGSPVDTERVVRTTTECIYCGRPLQPGEVTIDHIIPINGGGTHSNDNITGCCLSCNCRKRDKPFNKWLERMPAERREIARALYEERFGGSRSAGS